MFKEPRNLDYSYALKTIDSHTVGEYTRIIYDGFPALKGDTMMEKKHDLQKNYDFLRTALMLEPRGHRDMFGAVLTEPCNKEADFGVIFLDSGGCLNMCGHGSIGVASMVVETGMVQVTEPYTEVTLDTPSGLIKTKVHVVNKKAVDVTITNVPAFLYKKDIVLNIAPYGDIHMDVSFGGSFFALVDADKINVAIDPSNAEELSKLGMKILEEVNKKETFKHPTLDIDTVDLTEFYTHKCSSDANMKNCVVFGGAQIDRSPCGTGTSAKIATLFAKGELKKNEKFVYESITGSKFIGEVIDEATVGDYKAIIPQITGSAYITGLNTWFIDEDDPLKYGFMM
jgi:proline racemase